MTAREFLAGQASGRRRVGSTGDRAGRVCRVRTLLAVAAGTSGSADGARPRADTGSSDERDRALAGEIATGTLRWQAAFDHVIAAFAGRPVARLDPEVLAILRISMFQLLHLDRVPAAAVVNDAVELARKAGKTQRRRIRQRAAAARVARAGAAASRCPPVDRRAIAARLSRDHAVASALAGRALAGAVRVRGGRGLGAFDNAPAPLTLRANTLRRPRTRWRAARAQAGVDTEPAPLRAGRLDRALAAIRC